ncbi:C4-dicarboxylate ABC transporter substrate-binding protein [candidate division KSB3 bacterium]|uniref:C4-dicarboxylate ABC transporter substrate-binding protein n=1 Tax=candidate division KSB3 bacterium TaxID=2044937 RepID=A0A2G6E2T4_9BACT|nr:MAG: C4-dicarboxylate ABC transporter substrate-binding protein [candidate division KSB3 bacterium]PIE28641.1 MAG: C4-dicarboxylate ABC transporter substrate-binding protein [candidate division KSB3 bacterium]
MKKFSLNLCILIFSLALFLPSYAQSADVVIKLGHIAEPTNPYGQGADHFATLVAEKSGGEIDVKVFPSSQLGGQKELIEGLIFGTVDMALTGTAVLGTFQPQVALFDMPFLFVDRAHAYRALDSVGLEIGKALEPKGIKLLGYMENGIRHLTNNIRPIQSPTDMEGLKIRVMNNKVYIEMVKALGASPTPMAFAELYSALQQGTVDGQENPSAHIFTKRFFEVQKYASLTGHAYAPEPVLISMKTWNKLSDAHRAIIQEAAVEAIEWQRKLATKKDDEFWAKIKETGKMSVISVDRQPFIDATKSVYEEMAGIVGQDNIDKVRELAE